MPRRSGGSRRGFTGALAAPRSTAGCGRLSRSRPGGGVSSSPEMSVRPPLDPGEPSRARLMAGFAAIYFIWGSTFLAIRIAVAEIPPFIMAGARFLVAGLILFIWRRLARGERAEPGHWPGATLIGALLFMGGN